MVCRFLSVLFIGAVAMGMLPSSTLGQQERPCREDIEKFCKDLKRPELGACIRQHADEFSPECKARLKAAKELIGQRRDALKKACGAELQKYCKSTDQGPFRMMQCLKEHDADLSSGCKAEIAKRPARAAAGTPASGAAATAHKKPAGTPAH